MSTSTPAPAAMTTYTNDELANIIAHWCISGVEGPRGWAAATELDSRLGDLAKPLAKAAERAICEEMAA